MRRSWPPTIIERVCDGFLDHTPEPFHQVDGNFENYISGQTSCHTATESNLGRSLPAVWRPRVTVHRRAVPAVTGMGLHCGHNNAAITGLQDVVARLGGTDDMFRLGLRRRDNGEFPQLLEIKPIWAVYERLTELDHGLEVVLSGPAAQLG